MVARLGSQPHTELDVLATGDIIQVDVLGKPMLIINTRDVARDLIDKRSAIYSDRPRSVSQISSP